MDGFFDPRLAEKHTGSKKNEDKTISIPGNVCAKCMDNCASCTENRHCKRCAKGFPISEDASMCINFVHNNEKFAVVYTFTALFGVLVIFVSLCYAVCNCCTFEIDYDPFDYLSYNYPASDGENGVRPFDNLEVYRKSAELSQIK